MRVDESGNQDGVRERLARHAGRTRHQRVRPNRLDTAITSKENRATLDRRRGDRHHPAGRQAARRHATAEEWPEDRFRP